MVSRCGRREHFVNNRNGQRTNPVGWSWALVAVILLAGCSSNLPRYTTALPDPPPTTVLTLAPGDELEIKFQNVAELDDKQNIRPDGMISLQMVDDVQAAGLTPAELDRKLTELYASKLKEPVITVIVRTLANQKVYVGGEVKTPGLVDYQPGMTVLEALVAAGSPLKESADMSNIVVVRHKDGKRYMASYNIEEQFKQGTGTPFVLAPKDIVLVPQTGTDRANVWVDKHINRMIPRGDLAYLGVFASK